MYKVDLKKVILLAQRKEPQDVDRDALDPGDVIRLDNYGGFGGYSVIESRIGGAYFQCTYPIWNGETTMEWISRKTFLPPNVQRICFSHQDGTLLI